MSLKQDLGPFSCEYRALGFLSSHLASNRATLIQRLKQDRQFQSLSQESQKFVMSQVTCFNCYLWLPAIIFLFGFTSCVPTSFPPVSPCPALFTYRYDTNRTEYYGLVNLQTQPLKNIAEVQISFSIAAQLPSVSRCVRSISRRLHIWPQD